MSLHSAMTSEYASPSLVGDGSTAKVYGVIMFVRCSVIIIIKYYHDKINNKELQIQSVYYKNFICWALKFNLGPDFYIHYPQNHYPSRRYLDMNFVVISFLSVKCRAEEDF